MKKIVFFTFFLCTIVAFPVFCQLSDSFDDGNINSDPAWTGDTSGFVINEEKQLQLSAIPDNKRAYLATRSKSIINGTWEFTIELHFNPSSQNYADVYLVSDSAGLDMPLNGYFVRIGNTQDEISLYRQDGDRNSVVKIIDGKDDVTDTNDVLFRIRVLRDETGNWELWRTSSEEDPYILEGDVFDDSYYKSSYFGIYCQFTATRSDKFFFDNISVSGDQYEDHDPPFVDTAFVFDEHTIRIDFSETIKASSIIPNHFKLTDLGNPDSAKVMDNTHMMLFYNAGFSHPFYELTCRNIEDMEGNIIVNSPVPIDATAFLPSGENDLIITEIMVDPTPAIDLPEFEYIELYNPKTYPQRLLKYSMIAGDKIKKLPDTYIDANSYLILCASSAVDFFPENTIGLKGWPALRNNGDTLQIVSESGEQIFSTYYTAQQIAGGKSLEMIDLEYPCVLNTNWDISINPAGGTPGRKNSIDASKPDLTGPEIVKIIPTDSTELSITINEKTDPYSLRYLDIRLEPPIEIAGVEIQGPLFNLLKIRFSEVIHTKTTYRITLSGLKDCSGNSFTGKNNDPFFVLPEQGSPGDLVINEVLFDPLPGGVDFVELYNISDKYLNLKNWKLSNDTIQPDENSERLFDDDIVIPPFDFIVLTEDPSLLEINYPSGDPDKYKMVLSLPALNNQESAVVLLDPANNVIDKMYYSHEYHTPLISDPEGVSLERIDIHHPSWDSQNWKSAAGISGYATPGKMNSQHMSNTSISEEIIIDPVIFSPDDDGYNDFTNIRYQFSNPGFYANIKIVNLAGQTVKTLVQNHSIPSNGFFRWDGDNDQGQRVRIGPYIACIELYHPDGTHKQCKKKVIVGSNF